MDHTQIAQCCELQNATSRLREPAVPPSLISSSTMEALLGTVPVVVPSLKHDARLGVLGWQLDQPEQ